MTNTMTPLRIFISSVQTEFAQEREALRDYLRGDPLMRRFFEVFLFEDVPASGRLERVGPARGGALADRGAAR